MSVAGSEEVCETESVYTVNVRDIGNVALKVRICLGNKLIGSEPTEVITFEISDILTKSLYRAYFDINDIGRMGSYADLEQAFVILQACLSALHNESDSTSHRIEFGYIDAPQRPDEEKDEVMYDRKSITRAKTALKQKYRRINKDPSTGDSLILSVQFSSEMFSEFFAFPIIITNKDDETGRLMQMMKDRKLEIEEIKAERQTYKDELSKGMEGAEKFMKEFQDVKAENGELLKKVAVLEARMDKDEEGKDDKGGLKIAQFFPSANTASDQFIRWNSAAFDLLGAEFIQLTSSNRQINFRKNGYYRIIASTDLYTSNTGYLALHLDGGVKYYAYKHACTCATCHSTVRINQVMKLNANQYVQFYVNHNNTCYGTEQYTSLQIEFLQEA